ncbi:MAG: glycosyltransferase family 4 protein [Kiritimatiellae bacterium]|nr:glycosyltransferase family 4 protein [Kiritimatiellia bacterium]
MNSRPKIAILYPRTQSQGGALSVTAWMIHALQKHYRVIMVSLDRCDAERLNHAYGTAIKTDSIEWVSLEARHPRWAAFLVRLSMNTVDQYIMMRWAHRGFPEDVTLLSVNNEMSFGRRGLQYVNFPMLTIGRRDLARLVGQTGSWSKDFMGRVCRVVLGVRHDDLRINYTVCNSQWARAAYEEYYGEGVAAGWLYPPCTQAGVPSHEDWCKRESGIVMLGRLVPKKRVEDGLRTVQGLRDMGHDLHVHLVNSGGDASYRAQLEHDFGQSDWVHFEDNTSRERLLELVSQHRYGMHCNHSEHFGMATAEMSGSGCLVLGHNSGGTCEILPDAAQRYNTLEEGLERLLRLHTDPELQRRLLVLNREHSRMFSAEAFQQQCLAWVGAFFEDPDTQAPIQQGTVLDPPPRLALDVA